MSFRLCACERSIKGCPRIEIRTPGDDGVIIVGAGIGGLASAAALHKVGRVALVDQHQRGSLHLLPGCLQVGIPAVVLERSDMLREEGAAIGMCVFQLLKPVKLLVFTSTHFSQLLFKPRRWTNAFRALDAIGLAEPCRAAHPMNTRCEQSIAVATVQPVLSYQFSLPPAFSS